MRTAGRILAAVLASIGFPKPSLANIPTKERSTR